MHETDKSTEDNGLCRLLGTCLKPIADEPVDFVDYLKDLKKHQHDCKVAPARVFRAIEAMGWEDPKDEKDPKRKAFLEMLEYMNVKSYKAFRHVAGSQRFGFRFMTWLNRGATGGEEQKRFLIIEGGTGSGKDFLKFGIIRALEKDGTVDVVQDCPARENPLNLLKFIAKDHPEVIAAVAKESGIDEAELRKMLSIVRGEPCDHCYRKIFGSPDKPERTPKLDAIKVVKMRMSLRDFGVAELKPGSGNSYLAALRQGNRGFLSIEDGFMPVDAKPGEADERLILLSAPQYGVLPGIGDTANGIVGPTPLDEVIVVTTNSKALKQFLETLPDPEAFNQRATQLKLPYNTICLEEERTYREKFESFEKDKRPCLDPLAMQLVATLAVISRHAPPAKGKRFIHPIDRLRLEQGETIRVEPLSSDKWDEIWSYPGQPYSRDDSSNAPDPYKGGTPVTTGLIWTTIPEEDGMNGLDMRFMMGDVMSAIRAYGMMNKNKCLTAVDTILVLRKIIRAKLENSNLTDQQKAVFKRCLKWLGTNADAPMPIGLDDPENPTVATKNPGLLEKEYRRLLREHLLKVLEPNYDTLAQNDFEDYLLSALQWGKDSTQMVNNPRKGGRIPIEEGLLNEIDCYRLGKDPASYRLSDADKKFRYGLSTSLDDAQADWKKRHPDAQLSEFKPRWDEAIPDLTIAIRAKLDARIAKDADKLLATDVTSNLTDDEQKRLAQAKLTLSQLGYPEAILPSVLEYAKKTRVWSFNG